MFEISTCPDTWYNITSWMQKGSIWFFIQYHLELDVLKPFQKTKHD
mgnify:CR=1 FL=1